MTTGLERIASKARQEPDLKFNNLTHHITRELLGACLKTIPLDSAAGVDKLSVDDARSGFLQWSEECMAAVHNRGYRPPPVRRVLIPKPGKSEKRPIGVPTVYDRTLQRATAKVLESIYEQDFLEFSYGGRPNRNALQAVSMLKHVIANKKVSWVYEADLKNFFGSLDHSWVLTFLQHRVTDQRILTLVRRWLSAGVMDKGTWEQSEKGTPQGGSCSVILSNLYLHYALDLWFEKVVKPRLQGEAHMVRYLDDFVVCFQLKGDAERFQGVLDKRLRKFGLELEQSKTQLFEFGRFEKRESQKKGRRSPTFCFLGFRFYGFRAKTGQYNVGAVVDSTRRNRFINRLKESMRAMRHRSLKDQAKNINLKLRGYFNYFAIPLNSRRLASIRFVAIRFWKSVLSTRSQSGKVRWERFRKILEHHPIVRPKIRFTNQEFNALWQS